MCTAMRQASALLKQDEFPTLGGEGGEGPPLANGGPYEGGAPPSGYAYAPHQQQRPQPERSSWDAPPPQHGAYGKPGGRALLKLRGRPCACMSPINLFEQGNSLPYVLLGDDVHMGSCCQPVSLRNRRSPERPRNTNLVDCQQAFQSEALEP